MPDPDPRTNEATMPDTEHGAEPECYEPTWEKLDGMLDELPPGIPILPPEDACNFSKYSHKPRSFADGEAAKNCADAMESHNSNLSKGYREEIDTLLVFAGLFSAVVTGFVIDSYKWLQEDPNRGYHSCRNWSKLEVETGVETPVGTRRNSSFGLFRRTGSKSRNTRNGFRNSPLELGAFRPFLCEKRSVLGSRSRAVSTVPTSSFDLFRLTVISPNDVMVSLLAQIAQSLGPNNTILAASSQSRSGMSRAVSTRINVFWFLSLALSLSTSLFAILARQWIRELESPDDMAPLTAVAVRQLKLEGHEFWKVGQIISALPLLLQLSLALFAVGILDLLWHLHPAVATSVSIPALLAALFYLMTTVLPMLQYSRRQSGAPQPPQCAYKSPQAMLALQAYQIAASAWRPIWTRIRCRLGVPVIQTPGIHDHVHDNLLWGQIRSWSQWDEGFRNSDRYDGKPTVPALYYRGFRGLVLRKRDRNIRASVWSCIWEDATSKARQEGTILFPLTPADQQKRLRCNILHVTGHSAEMLDNASPRTCALIVLPFVMAMDKAFVAECLIQNFASLDVVSVHAIFWFAKLNFSQDPELIASLVRAVASFGRQHLRLGEDIGPVLFHVGLIVSYCWDPEIRLALQFIVVDLALIWVRSVARPAIAWMAHPLATLLSYVLDDICRDSRDFVSHPEAVHSLAGVQDLAALVRAFCECEGLTVTWPLPACFEDVVLICTRSPENLAQSDDKRNIEARIPLIRELLRISVRGTSCGDDVLPSPERRDEGSAHIASPVSEDGVTSLHGVAHSTAPISRDRVAARTDMHQGVMAVADRATITLSPQHSATVAGLPQEPALRGTLHERATLEPGGPNVPRIELVVVRRDVDGAGEESRRQGISLGHLSSPPSEAHELLGIEAEAGDSAEHALGGDGVEHDSSGASHGNASS